MVCWGSESHGVDGSDTQSKRCAHNRKERQPRGLFNYPVEMFDGNIRLGNTNTRTQTERIMPPNVNLCGNCRNNRSIQQTQIRTCEARMVPCHCMKQQSVVSTSQNRQFVITSPTFSSVLRNKACFFSAINLCHKYSHVQQKNRRCAREHAIGAGGKRAGAANMDQPKEPTAMLPKKCADSACAEFTSEKATT